MFLEAENLEGSDDINSIPNDTQMDNSTDVAEKSALAEVEKNLKDFQNRQQKMVNIFNDKKIITDSDLEKALLNGVYDNVNVAMTWSNTPQGLFFWSLNV